MNGAPTETSRIIIRMRLADRQAISTMMQHKRSEFEYHLTRGVISMLNAKAQHLKLSEKRKEYLKILDEKSKRNKDRLSGLSNQVKSSTANAPMGFGTATHVAASVVNGVGSEIIDNADAKRREDEAKEDLSAAQLLGYVSNENYAGIAERVASILGYRFQFLLFRLAPGEQGYIKLADFFIDSMKKNAIARLQEHMDEVVQALIDAAISNVKDPLNNSEWDKRNIIFVSHKTLELDEAANDILKRCGPAVRALLGGYARRFDKKTGRVELNNAFTIVGALTHAPIVNYKGEVCYGLGTKHRKDEILDGNNKYPVILAGRGETSANLGLDFGTSFTGSVLHDQNIEALRRLLPDFFEYTPSYEVESNAILEKLTLDNPADLRYHDEQFECPWTKSRDIQWMKRVQYIWEEGSKASQEDEEEVVETSHTSVLGNMKAASSTFDLCELKEDIIKVKNVVLKAQIDIYNTLVASDLRSRKQLEAAVASKYAAIVISNLMDCIVKYGSFPNEYNLLAIDTLEEASAAINVSRELPLEETRNYRDLTAILHHQSQCTEHAYQLKLFCQKTFQTIVDALHKIPSISSLKPFLIEDEAARSQSIKDLWALAKKLVDESEEFTALALAIADNTVDALGDNEVPQQDVAIADIILSSDSVRQELYHTDLTEVQCDVNTLIIVIALCEMAIQRMYEDIRVSLQSEDCWIAPDDSWTEGQDVSLLSRAEINLKALAVVKELHSTVSNYFKTASDSIAHPSLFRRHYPGVSAVVKQSIYDKKVASVAAKIKIKNILNNIKFSKRSDFYSDLEPDLVREAQTDVELYLARATLESELCKLRFIAYQKSVLGAKAQPQLHTALSAFDSKIRNLKKAIKVKSARDSSDAKQDAILAYSQLNRKMSFVEFQEKVLEVNHARNRSERAIVSDTEFTDFAIHRSKRLLVDIEGVAQEIADIKERLEILKIGDIDATEGSVSSSIFDVFSEQSAVVSQSEHITDLVCSDDLLDELLEVFSSKSMLSSVVLGKSPKKGGVVQQALMQMMSNIPETTEMASNHFILSRQDFGERLVNKINWLKTEIPKSSCHLGDNWGLWLLVNTAIWLIEKTQTSPLGINEKIMQAKIAQLNIEKITEKKQSSMQIARKMAMKKINQAYKDIHVAKVTLSENIRKLHGKDKAFDVVANTLNWSGSLTHNELQWLDRKIAEKPRVKLGPDFKSPVVLIYFTMSVYSAQLLDRKKKAISQLCILENNLNVCKKILYDFNNVKNDLNPEMGLDKLCEEYEHLARLLCLKMEQADQERKDADIQRNSVLSQGPRIFFNEWKIKTHDPAMQSQRIKVLKQAKQERHKKQARDIDSIIKKEEKKVAYPTTKFDRVVNLKDDAANVTLEDLDEMLKAFRSNLEGVMKSYMTSKGFGSRRLGKSYSFYSIHNGSNGSDNSPDLSLSSLVNENINT